MREFPRFAKIYALCQKSKLPPVWQRLQFAKSSPPNARRPLWHVAQLFPRPEAKCITARGSVTCLPRGISLRTVWHDAQPTRECAECEKLAGIAATPPRRGPGCPSSWHVLQEARSAPESVFASGWWHWKHVE